MDVFEDKKFKRVFTLLNLSDNTEYLNKVIQKEVLPDKDLIDFLVSQYQVTPSFAAHVNEDEVIHSIRIKIGKDGIYVYLDRLLKYNDFIDLFFIPLNDKSKQLGTLLTSNGIIKKDMILNHITNNNLTVFTEAIVSVIYNDIIHEFIWEEFLKDKFLLLN